MHRRQHEKGDPSKLACVISFEGELECKNLGDCENANQGVKERFNYDIVIYPDNETLKLPFLCKNCEKPAPVWLRVRGFRWEVHG